MGGRARWIVGAVMLAAVATGAGGCRWAALGPPPPVPPFHPGVLRAEQLPTIWPGPAPGPLVLRRIVVMSRSTWWGVTQGPGGGSGLLETQDAGRTWREHYRTGLPVTALQFLSAREGYAVENGCGVGQCQTSALLRTRDGGRRWSTTYATHRRELASLSFVSAEWGYRVAKSGRQPWVLGFSADGGATWVSRSFPCPGSPASVAVSFVTRGGGYLACGPPASDPTGATAVWVTHDGGLRWALAGTAASGEVTGLTFVSGSVGYLGTRAGLWVTRDGGRAWAVARRPQIAAGQGVASLGRMGRQVYLLSAGRAWAVSARGAWSSLYPLPNPHTAVVWPTAQQGYGVGEAGAPTAVMAGTPGRRGWTTVGYLPGPARTLVSASSRTLWAVDPRWYVSRDGGRTWQTPALPGAAVATDASACGRYGFVLMGRRTVRVTTNGGRSVGPAEHLPFAATSVACQAPRVGFALGRPAGATVRGPGGKRVHVAPGAVYLWRTTDGGATWMPSQLPPVLNMAAPTMVRFLGPRLGWMWSANGYWLTRNGGQSWVARAMPAGVLIRSLAFDSPTAAVVVVNTGVYTTSDGGRTWVPVS